MSQFESEDERNVDPEKIQNAMIQKFQSDFIKGCIAFITIAATVRNDDRDGETVFQQMIDPLVGNRNRNGTGFDTIMPELYKKVIEYCSEALIISDSIENEME